MPPRVSSFLFPVGRLRRAWNAKRDAQLERCGVCGRDFVNPVEWAPDGPEHWWLLLRCGECETWRDITVTNEVARRYDAELDRRGRVLAALLERLDRERMIVEAEALTIALRRGLIDAADFATERKRGSTSPPSSSS